jgi:hypothetical protein
MKALPRIIPMVFASIWLAGMSAKANLIQATDPSFGANSLTIDTSSGLGWLNLTASAGLSYQQVQADTQPGGIFYGFRFATAQEVLNLYSSAGFSTGNYPSATQPILLFLSMIGATSYQDGNPETFGISGTALEGLQIVPGVDFFYNSGVPTYGVTGVPGSTLAYGPGTAYPTVGSWLVEDVPEKADPIIYVLAAGAVAAIVSWHRRRNAPANI